MWVLSFNVGLIQGAKLCRFSMDYVQENTARTKLLRNSPGHGIVPERVPSEPLLKFQPSAPPDEYISARSLGPRSVFGLGSVCWRKPSRLHSCSGYLSSIATERRQESEEWARASVMTRSCTGPPPVRDGARDAHIPLGKIDVASFQAEHLALSQAGRGRKENQRSFSNV
jgi:hypothetical protein